jgi:hypothetical protein
MNVRGCCGCRGKGGCSESIGTKYQWLTSIILASREAEIRRIRAQAKKVRPYLKILNTKKGPVEWLK